MNYLLPSEYELYGLEATVPSGLIGAASALMDAHCRRTTLMVAQYTERMRLAPPACTVRLSYLPLATVAPALTPFLAVRARYAPLRRDETAAQDPLPGDVARAFALPGAWIQLDPAGLDFEAQSGELRLASHPLGFWFNEVEVTYKAGLSTIPDTVKFACAQVVRNALATPALNVRSGSVSHMHLQYFSDSLLDANVRAALAPYVAQRMAS